MRKEVEARAAEAIYETMVCLRRTQVTSPATVRVRFDEFKLEADVDYRGAPIQFPEAPPAVEELSKGEQALAMLSGYMIRQHADTVSVSHVHLHFDH